MANIDSGTPGGLPAGAPAPAPAANAIPDRNSGVLGEGQSKRVNVIFSADTYNTLQELAQSQKINLSDALRQAINVSSLVVKANKDPDSRVLIDRGGKTQELKLV